MRAALGLLVAAVLALLSGFETYAANARVCVAALLPESDPGLRAVIHDSIFELRRQGIRDPENRFKVVYGTPNGIHECLGGGYQGWVLAGHTIRSPQNQTTLVYVREQRGMPPSFVPLSCRFFCGLEASPVLRSMDLVTCNAEQLMQQCSCLGNLAKRHHWELDIAPIVDVGGVSSPQLQARTYSEIRDAIVRQVRKLR